MIRIRVTAAIPISVLVGVTWLIRGNVALAQQPGDTLYRKSGPPIRFVDSSYHLSGPGVIRFGPNINFIDYKRVVIQGTRTGRGCLYHSYGLGQFPSERVVEADELLCVQVRARGVFRNLPETLGHGRVAPFSTNFDSTLRSADSARSDTMRRKP